MHVRGFGTAHVGRQRESNQDCWLVDDQIGLYVVADGMGGHRGGELAAATAVDGVARAVRGKRELLDQIRAGAAKPLGLGLIVNEACQAASLAVFERASQDQRVKGMGCTLTVLLISGRWGVMGHVGDSRLYLCRRGAVHQLSDDHTYAAELARQGAIDPSEVKAHPYAHILTEAVGNGPAVQADVLRFQLFPEDRLLLCSDGLSNYVTDHDRLARELGEEDAEGIPADLVRFANEAGGADNVTALVVTVEAEPDAEVVETAQLAQKHLRALEGCFLFSELSLARKAWLLTHCQLREESAGPLVTQGEPLRGLSIVVEGTVEVSREGAELATLGPGQHWGASALLSARAARATVTAAGPALTLLLTREDFRTLTRSRPRLGLILLRRLAAELSKALDQCVASGSAAGWAFLSDV